MRFWMLGNSVEIKTLEMVKEAEEAANEEIVKMKEGGLNDRSEESDSETE